MSASHDRPGTCGRCVHFDNAADRIERALPGLRALSSAHASVRGRDGICALHDRYLSPSASCDGYVARNPKATSGSVTAAVP